MSSHAGRRRGRIWTVTLGVSTILLAFIAPTFQPDIDRFVGLYPWSRFLAASVVAIAILATFRSTEGARESTALKTDMSSTSASGSQRWPAVVHGSFPASPDFVIERIQVSLITKALERDGSTVSIIGEPGTGKTQIAAQVVARADLSRWFLVAWIQCEPQDAMLETMAALARRLDLCSAALKTEEAAAALRDYLQTTDKPSLIVFDSVVGGQALSTYRPNLGRASVILTSFDRDVSVGETVLVDAYTDEQARAYLDERLGREEDPSPLINVLDRSPLGLSHAAAILLAMPALSLAVLADRLRKFPLAQALPREESSGYPRSVAEAMLFALQIAESRVPGARKVGLLCAVSYGTGPRFELAQAFAHAAAGDAVSDLALGALDRFSLTQWSTAGETLFMHSIVRKVLVDDAGVRGELADVLREAAEVLIGVSNRHGAGRIGWASRLSDIEHAHNLWAVAAPLVHGAAVDESRTARDWLTPVADVTAWAVGRDAEDGRDERAVRVGEPLVASCSRVLGAGHPVTLKAQGSLAFAYLNLGSLTEALGRFKAVAQARERMYGAGHEDTDKAWNNVATAYRRMGKFDEAIAVLVPLFTRRAALAGTSDEGTIALGNTLAAVYLSARRWNEARDLLERLVQWCDAAFGPNHQGSLAVRNHLCQAYGALGVKDQQARLLAECADGTKNLMGAEHPYALKAVNNLAVFRAEQGNRESAIELLGEALAVARRALPPGHETRQLLESNMSSLVAQPKERDD